MEINDNDHGLDGVIEDFCDRPTEFSAFYAANWGALVGFLTATLRDQALSEDLASDAFAVAMVRWERVSRMDYPLAWLYRVAINLSRRSLKRGAMEIRRMIERERIRPDCVQPFDPSVSDALNRLSPRQRTAILLRYTAGLTEREVGQTLGISEGGTSALLARARQELRSALGETRGNRP